MSEIYFDDYGDMLFFDYDSNGMRLRKEGPLVDSYNYSYTNNDLFYIDYYYDGDTLIYERRSGNGNNASERFTIEYVYGVNGITGFRIHQGNTTTDYFYVKNIMGDVLGIVDSSGTLVAEYRYDAYGNPVMILDGNGNDVSNNYAHIANINPIRYRGYYYDVETGFYYLNSRYYDPVIGRFINADTTDVLAATPMGLTDKNLYAYCDNNPVTRMDNGGQFWDAIFDVVSLAISIVDVVENPSDPLAWVGLAADVISLAVPGLTGGGAIVKTLNKADDVADVVKTANKVDNTVKTINSTKSVGKGWKVGDNISNLTAAGNAPSWSTVRRRYWKNEAFFNPSKYPNDLGRMKRGLAPIGSDGFSMELHHTLGRKGQNFYVFEPLTQTQHRYIHYGK